jgi:peptidoglycan/LPS O-acetylase OafA/YrhL
MAVIFGLAVLYHAAALSIPAFTKAAYPATYPPLRHVAFIMVNSLAAFLFLKRPRWLIWPYMVLTAQVLQGHGVRLRQTWVDAHKINWIDVIVVCGVLLGLVLLLQERKEKRNKTSAG